MNFTDPFQADTSQFKELIDSTSSTKYIEVEEVQAEEGNPLDMGTVKGLPPSAFNRLREATEKLDRNVEQRNQVSKMFNQLFSDLNSKYGLNVKLDFDSFSNSLSYIIEPSHKKAMEYYLSEAYGRFRVVLYGQYLQSIALLSSQILNPEYLLSDSMTYTDKLDIMQRLYEFMSTMNDIYKEVNIPDSEMRLEKLNDTNQTIDLSSPEVRSVLDRVLQSINTNKDIEK